MPSPHSPTTTPPTPTHAARQVFMDRTGRRWRVSKYILGFLLIGLIVLSFFGLDATYRSTRSLLALQAQEETVAEVNRYPVVYELGSTDYAHFKEYYPHFEEVLYHGEFDGYLSGLRFHGKYFPDTPKYYLLDAVPGATLSPELLNSLQTWDFNGVVLRVGLAEVSTRSTIAPVLEQLQAQNLQVHYSFTGDTDVPAWITQSAASTYRFVDMRDLQEDAVSLGSNETLLFEYAHTTRGGQTLTPEEFRQNLNELPTPRTIEYRTLGTVADYQVVDSVTVQNYLVLHPSVRRYGFANLRAVDSRAWSLSVGGLPQEYLPSTAIDVRGSGEMYYLVQEAQPIRARYRRAGDIVTSAELVEVGSPALVQRYGLQPNTINLSFDDGPHPEWTPKVLDYLAREDLSATFFVTGNNVRKYPDVARRIVEEGHEIANHTYFHPRTYELPPKVFLSEVEETQKAIQEVTGVTARYFRTPYNDTDGYKTNRDLKNLRLLQEAGLQVSEFETDTRDWTKPGVATQVANIEAQLDTGTYSQLLFHDGGGDRAQTLEALPEVVELLRARDVEMVPLSTLHSQHQVRPPRHSLWWRARYAVESFSARYLQAGIAAYARFFAYLMLAKLVLTLFLFGLALVKKRRFTTAQPGVSILIPAYNEEKTILDTIRSVLASDYPRFEIIVINDGSTDNSRTLLDTHYGSHPQVQLIHKPNGGKAAASNTGITRAKYDYIMSIDADTVMEPHAVSLMMRNFTDEQVAGVAGNVHVGNFHNFLTQTQRAEYIYGQSFDKEIYSLMNAIPVVPGAIGIWRKTAVLEAGGYTTDTLAEDTDLTLQIRRLGYKIIFERRAVVITEAPDTLNQFMKQRNRWMYGTLQCLWKHRAMILNPRYGYLGLVILPEILLSFLFLGMVLVYAYLLGVLLVNYTIAFFNTRADINSLIDADTSLTLMYVLGSLGIYYLINVLAVLFDNNRRKWQVLWYLPYQMVIYRFLLWTVQWNALLRAIRGAQQGWDHLTRKGLKLPS